MREIMKIEPYKRTAHYYETDQMGIVHHSNYIRWFEEARLDALNQLGLSYKKMEEGGLLIPVLSAECQYRQAVKYDETVNIYLNITDFKGVKFSFAYTVKDKTNQIIKATGTSSHCFTDSQLKPVWIKKKNPAIYQVFQDYIGK